MAGDCNWEGFPEYSLIGDLLQLSLPDNDQTWLYSIPGSDPLSILDLDEFLSSKSTSTNKYIAQADDKRGCYPINTRTFTRHKKQSLLGFGKKHISNFNQHNTNLDGSSRTQERSTMPYFSSQSSQVNQKPDHRIFVYDNESTAKTEQDNPYVVGQQEFDGFSLINSLNNTLNNNVENKSSNLSNFMDISDHTFLMDVSAPKGLLDSTYSTVSSDSTHLSKHNFTPFLPKSVSTPTRTVEKLKDKYKINLNKTIDQFEVESRANANLSPSECSINNTYDVLGTSGDHIDDINMNITHIISSPTVKFEPLVETKENTEFKSLSKRTCELEDCEEEYFKNPMSLYADPICLPPKNDLTIEIKDDDNFPYATNTEADLNSTMIIKSKDIDSEQDSCYSSSSNLRSLGDVCVASDLQLKKKNDLHMKKAKSENSLCSIPDKMTKVQPDKYHGSALNLVSHHSNRYKGDEYQQKQNFLLKRQEKQTDVPFPVNTTKDTGITKTTSSRQLSKIPRPQSRIPKFNVKKN